MQPGGGELVAPPLTPPRHTQASLRMATLPLQGRVRTESAARITMTVHLISRRRMHFELNALSPKYPAVGITPRNTRAVTRQRSARCATLPDCYSPDVHEERYRAEDSGLFRWENDRHNGRRQRYRQSRGP